MTSNPAICLHCVRDADARQPPATARHRKKRQNQAHPKAPPSAGKAPTGGQETSPNGNKPVCPKHRIGKARLGRNPADMQREPSASEKANQENQNYPTNYGCNFDHRARYGPTIALTGPRQRCSISNQSAVRASSAKGEFGGKSLRLNRGSICNRTHPADRNRRLSGEVLSSNTSCS